MPSLTNCLINNNLLSGTLPSLTGFNLIATFNASTNSFSVYTPSTLSVSLTTLNLSTNTLPVSSIDQCLADVATNITLRPSTGCVLSLIQQSPAVPTNAIKYVTITNGGTGYIVGDTISPTNGGGAGCTLTVATVNVTTVLTVTITLGGSGYTSAPTTFSTSGVGINFAATLQTDKLKIVAQGWTVLTS